MTSKREEEKGGCHNQRGRIGEMGKKDQSSSLRRNRETRRIQIMKKGKGKSPRVATEVKMGAKWAKERNLGSSTSSGGPLQGGKEVIGKT